jgi:hypothetical protein
MGRQTFKSTEEMEVLSGQEDKSNLGSKLEVSALGA